MFSLKLWRKQVVLVLNHQVNQFRVYQIRLFIMNGKIMTKTFRKKQAIDKGVELSIISFLLPTYMVIKKRNVSSLQFSFSFLFLL